jgi:hypothetical protein
MAQEARLYEPARSRASQVSKMAIHDDVGELGYPRRKRVAALLKEMGLAGPARGTHRGKQVQTVRDRHGCVVDRVHKQERRRLRADVELGGAARDP